jgi:hypothetical protein
MRATMATQLERPNLSARDAIAEALVYRYFVPHVFGLYHALAFVAACRGRLWVRSDDTLSLLDLKNPTTLTRFREGYASPSAEWMASLLQTWPVGRAIGVHYSFDFNRESSV